MNDTADGIFDGNTFDGVFDGNNHNIYNLTIDTNCLGKDFLGFFGSISKRGKIINLGIENVRFSGTKYDSTSNLTYSVGALAGNNDGNIGNCYSTGSIVEGNNSGNIGGLVGVNKGIIQDCCSAASVMFGGYSWYVGGLVAWNAGTINNCFTTGDINESSGRGGGRIGGLVGGNLGLIKYCYSTESVCAGTAIQGVGDLVGGNGGTISYCYSTGSINVGYTAIWTGGLVGINGGQIQYSFSTGSITGNGASELGGIVGENNGGSLRNCYSNSYIMTQYSQFIGGLIGYAARSDINDCFSTGIASGDAFVGGLIGKSVNSNINSSYFLDIAGPDNGFGTSLTDTQMKQQNSFVGWDFVNETTNGANDSWTINQDVNYPKLVWPMMNPVSSRFPFGWYEVDFADFTAMATWWGNENCSENNNCNGADLDFSNTVDINDLMIFCSHWLDRY